MRRVLSHPVALGQCRLWLARHLPDAELVSAWDTAGSAEIVARKRNPALAAIAARHAADVYGLVPLAERIEDDPTNQTRFLVFSRGRRPAATGRAARAKRHATRRRSSCSSTTGPACSHARSTRSARGA